jgi:starvation-inducible DNA-binding protein
MELINPDEMKVSIGLTPKNTEAVAVELSKILADEYILYTKTRNAHWNVEGPDFLEKHTFFENQFKELDVFVDTVAERIRAIGHYAPATLGEFLELTRLSEKVHERNNSHGFIRELLTDHESIIMKLRENIHYFSDECHDMGSSDFITGLMEKHEKMAWILRSHFQ